MLVLKCVSVYVLHQVHKNWRDARLLQGGLSVVTTRGVAPFTAPSPTVSTTPANINANTIKYDAEDYASASASAKKLLRSLERVPPFKAPTINVDRNTSLHAEEDVVINSRKLREEVCYCLWSCKDGWDKDVNRPVCSGGFLFIDFL